MLFGVFDGHGGHQVSQFTKTHFKSCFINSKQFKDGHYKAALENAFLKMDEKIQKSNMETLKGSKKSSKPANVSKRSNIKMTTNDI